MHLYLTHAGQHEALHIHIYKLQVLIRCVANLLGSICSNYHMYIGMYSYQI